jgi:hypothetical protein
MPAHPGMSPQTIREVSRRLLEPYTIPADSPYLSEDQQRLCRLTLRERSAWMAEWLHWAQSSEYSAKSSAGR